MNTDDGYKKFIELFDKYNEKKELFNEADTRAKIIDYLLKDCLGWSEEDIKRETYTNSGFIDYELFLNNSCTLVIEAKKAGKTFEIPNSFENRSYILDASIASVKELTDAITQVRQYCDDTACKFAAVFNGYQIIIFTAITVGKPWKKGKAIVFHSLEDIKKNFSLFWNILSKENVINGSLSAFIERQKKNINFSKIREDFHYADTISARNELYTFIRPLTEYIFSELLDEAQTRVLKECYVYGRSNNPLAQEIKEYFTDKLPHVLTKYKIKDIIEDDKKAGTFQSEYEAKIFKKSTGSLLVLLGGIGSGKTTFLHRFFKIILKDKEKQIWFYIDFRMSPVDVNDIEDFILKKLFNAWENKYEQQFCKKLDDLGFNSDKQKLKEYFIKLFNFLREINYSITLIIDNVDQHDRQYQEKIFIEANYLTDIFKTVTIIAIREETFLISSKRGVFDAYSVPKFHIASPNFLSMIKRRIDFLLKVLKTNNDFEFIEGLSEQDKSNLIQYFNIIKYSLNKGNFQSRSIVNFMDSISVGNMRDALEMFNNFLVSGNTNIGEIFSKHKLSGGYQIAFHQFVKSIMLSEHRYYIQENSKIFNVFDFDYSISDSHFNCLRILNYLLNKQNKSSDVGRGYIQINELLSKTLEVSIPKDVITSLLLKLASFNLIEFDNQSKKSLEHAEFIKLTHSGRYYIECLIYEFVYLNLIHIDTPISDVLVEKEIKKFISNAELDSRLHVTIQFVNYLKKCEETEFNDYPEYRNNEFTNVMFMPKIVESISKSQKYFKEQLGIE